MLRPSLLHVLAASLPLLVACGGDGTGPDNTRTCTRDVSITVSAGTTPTFTWDPECRVIGLLVEHDASDMWFLEGTGPGIAPGVRYGTVPPGATGEDPALPLVAGTTYEVILFRGTPENAVIAAIEEFTP